MSEWKEYKLGDFADINPAESMPKGTIAKKIPMQFIQPFSKQIPGYTLEEYKGGVKFRNGDTLMARITPSLENGKTSYVDILEEDEIGFGSTEFIVLREKENVSDKHFLYYLAISPTIRFAAIKSMTGSSGRQRVQTDVVKEHVFYVPELEEQRAIASVLSSLDDKIDLLHRQNQTLEQMAETLFRQRFVEEADEEWEWFQLDEFVEVHRGLSYKGAGLTEAKNGIPMHNLNSVFEGGGYKEAGIKYYKGEFKERHKAYPGDVIITNTEQGHEHLLIGYPAIVPSNFGEHGIFSQHIYRLEIKSKLSNFFLFHLLKTHDVHEQVAGATNGSTVNMLAKDGVEWVKFKMPPQELAYLIDEFTKTANDFYRKQELNQTQIRTLTALRDTLLPKLMSGEIRIDTNA